MAPKRRRVDEDVEDVDDVQAEETCSNPKPHDELWFGDGSIVLATDVHLYRVHKSMLAKYSTVLRDMFEIPSGGANTECWEGVPIVKMVGDSDEDVCALLKALYDRKFQHTLEGTDLCVISSLLSMATKYDFRDIRVDVMQHLESSFPSTYEKYKVSKLQTLPRPFTYAQLFTLLGVAHRCGAMSIQPVLYYRCASLPIEKIIDLAHARALPEECLKNLLVGREILSTTSQSFNLRSLSCANLCCYEHFRHQAQGYIDSDLNFKLVLDLHKRGILDNCGHGVCRACERRYLDYLKQAKEVVWEGLPEAFLNKVWKEFT